jgi:hypothetical protein
VPRPSDSWSIKRLTCSSSRSRPIVVEQTITSGTGALVSPCVKATSTVRLVHVGDAGA